MPTVDFYGNPIPVDAYDIGIHEHQKGTGPTGGTELDLQNAFCGGAKAIATNPNPQTSLVIRPPILLFHSIGLTGAWGNINTTFFGQIIDYLDSEGYTPLTWPELYSLINGQECSYSKPIVIAFDDAYVSQYTSAYINHLLPHAFSFFIFPPTDHIGQAGMLTWANINTMVDSGYCWVGNHTITHAHLISISDAAVITEIQTSQERLLANITYTNHITTSIAWPFEEWTYHLFDLATSAGIGWGFSGLQTVWTQEMVSSRKWLLERQYIADATGAGDETNCTTLAQLQQHIDRFGYESTLPSNKPVNCFAEASQLEPPKNVVSSVSAYSCAKLTREVSQPACLVGETITPSPPDIPPTGGWWSLGETLPITKAGDRYAYPRNEAAPLPIPYGDLRVNAVKGVWEIPCIDIYTYIYLIADCAVISAGRGNTFAIYNKDDELIDSANYTVYRNYLDEAGYTIAYVQFGSSQESAEPLTICCAGKMYPSTHENAGALITNPISIARDYLEVWRNAQNADFNQTALSESLWYAGDQGYAAAGVIQEDTSPGKLLSQLLTSFFAQWWKDNRGQLVFKFMHGPGDISQSDVADNLEEKYFINIQCDARLENLANNIGVNYAYNWKTKDFIKTDSGKTTADIKSETFYGTLRKDLELLWVRDTIVAQKIQSVALDWYKAPRLLIRIVDDTYKYVHLERGDLVTFSYVTLSDEQGLPLKNQICRVMEIQFELDGGTIELALLDMGIFLTTSRSIWFEDTSKQITIPGVSF
jgi:peptidoglycan/xylan/chitin deacetylase (PgdA/CDA1 family)